VVVALSTDGVHDFGLRAEWFRRLSVQEARRRGHHIMVHGTLGPYRRRLHRNLHQDCAHSSPGGGALFCERGTPVVVEAWVQGSGSRVESVR